MDSFSTIGNRSQDNSGSFWPSFTDVMMVIVMIFLFATSLLIVRNYNLVAELQDSLAAEKRAEAMIESTSLQNATLEQRLNSVEREIANTTQENATLEERLTNYEQENSLLRLQVMAKEERLRKSLTKAEQQNKLIEELMQKNQTMLASLKEKDRTLQDNAQTLAQMRSEKTQLAENITQIQSQLDASIQETKQLNASKTALNEQMNQLQTALTQSQLEFDALTKTNAQNESTISLLEEQKALYNNELLTLKGEYEVVKAKYQQLIKPARSAKGKYVAEVHYIKSANKNLIRYKEPSDTNYSELKLKDVENKLDKLKQKYGKDLYVKIIIPKNSGLTYSEAWTFMKNLLDKYDYYYQKTDQQEQ